MAEIYEMPGGQPRAAFATTARVAWADFSWTRGEDRLRDYASSPGKRRTFCRDCGGSILAAWGTCGGCPEDLDGNGEVNGADVGLLLAVWGACP